MIKKPRKKYKFHPLADAFRLMQGDEFAALVANIAANGCREPITLYEKKILDGRNRYRACLKAKKKPKYVQLPETIKPIDFVISTNNRRHDSVQDRARAAAKLATMSEGRPKKTNSKELVEISQADAAKKLGVSVATVKRAKKVLDEEKKFAALTLRDKLASRIKTRKEKALKQEQLNKELKSFAKWLVDKCAAEPLLRELRDLPKFSSSQLVAKIKEEMDQKPDS